MEEFLDDSSLLIYYPNFLDTKTYIELKEWLDLQNYESGSTTSGNKIDREQIWFQKDNKYFCPLWKRRDTRWESKKYNNLLINIQTKIDKFLKKHYYQQNTKKYDFMNYPSINSCLINKYYNGNSFITPHNDSVVSFGEMPTIIGLSIGDTRKIVFKEKVDKKLKDKKIHEKELEDNSIFVMTGNSQKNFTHEIPKEVNKSLRYSLTFREMII